MNGRVKRTARPAVETLEGRELKSTAGVFAGLTVGSAVVRPPDAVAQLTPSIPIPPPRR